MSSIVGLRYVFHAISEFLDESAGLSRIDPSRLPKRVGYAARRFLAGALASLRTGDPAGVSDAVFVSRIIRSMDGLVDPAQALTKYLQLLESLDADGAVSAVEPGGLSDLAAFFRRAFVEADMDAYSALL